MISNIKRYYELRTTIENIRSTSVDRTTHGQVLEVIYSQVLGAKITVGATKEEDVVIETGKKPDWTILGFQGTDPLSDFRGGGLLSLQQLAFFADNFLNEVKSINLRANHPTKGYGWSITGINITVMLIKALKSGVMKKYFYTREVTIDQFHLAFCQAYIYFDKLWAAEDPEDIMQFSKVFAIFREEFVVCMKAGREMQFDQK